MTFGQHEPLSSVQPVPLFRAFL